MFNFIQIRAVVFILTIFISTSGYSLTFFVNDNSPCTGCTGNSWGQAYKSLQEALTAAAGGDEIWVADGRYIPDAANIDISFAMKNGVSIYGGFNGTETGRTQRNPAVNLTILSGDLSNNDSPTNIDITETTRFENSVHVITANTAIIASTVLDGFIVQSGNASKQTPGSFTGGGIQIIGTLSSALTVRNCIFRFNTSNFGGGAAEIGGNTTPVFDSCTFFNNITTSGSSGGGAVKCQNSSRPVFRNCTFQNNSNNVSTGSSGGAVYINNTSSTEFYSCLFKGNVASGATSSGGAVNLVSANQAYGKFTNCIFTGNSATNGGAVYLWDSRGDFINCVFYNNTNRALFTSSTAIRSNVYNSIFQGNGGENNNGGTGAPMYYNTILQSTACPVAAICDCGVFNGNALFVDPANDDFRLSAGSPALNTGDATIVTETMDYYGSPRVVNGFVDMGVHESTIAEVAEVDAMNGVTPLPDASITPLDFGTTNQGTNISRVITITNNGTGALTICDTTITAGFAFSGSYARKLAPGASTSITIIMDATILGAKTGSLTFAANDANESLYEIKLSGNVVVCAMPSAAGLISGDALVCSGTTNGAYSISTVGNATGYTWSLPSGSAIASGINTNSITINTITNPGTITVTPTNVCGDGTSASVSITIDPLPDAAGIVSGPAEVCAGETGLSYSVAAVNNTTTYIWTIPSGATIASGANTNSIVLDMSTASGIIMVEPSNNCGTSAAASVNVLVNDCDTVVPPASTDVVVYAGISPNNDGKNDFLYIENIELHPGNTFKMYDREGNLLVDIEAYDNVNNRWEGDSKNKKMLSAGTYYYVLKLSKDADSMKGFVTLQR